MSAPVSLVGGCMVKECAAWWRVSRTTDLVDELRVREPQPLVDEVVAGGSGVYLLGRWVRLVGCGCLSGWRRLVPRFPLRGFVGYYGGCREREFVLALVGFVGVLVEEVARFSLLYGAVCADARVPEVVGGSVCCVDHACCAE